MCAPRQADPGDTPCLFGQFQARERLHLERQWITAPEEGRMKWSSGLDLHIHAYVSACIMYIYRQI